MKPNSLTIRLDATQEQWLEQFSAKMKVSKAVVIGWAIDALADYAALHNGKPPMPIDFAEFWQIVQSKAPAKIDAWLRDPETPYPAPQKPASDEVASMHNSPRFRAPRKKAAS